MEIGLAQRLRLSPEEIAAVARTGFVARERRGPACVVYKLRFRIGARQCVRYLGVDTEWVAAVREALRELQRARDALRNLRRLAIQARAFLRELKPRLAANAEHEGYHFHGLALRRARILRHDDR